MFRVLNWIGSLLGGALVLYGLRALLFGGVETYLLATGQAVPGTPTFLGEPAPEIWEAVEQLASGLTGILFGWGAIQLVRMRLASHRDDQARLAQSPPI